MLLGQLAVANAVIMQAAPICSRTRTSHTEPSDLSSTHLLILLLQLQHITDGMHEPQHVICRCLQQQGG